MRAGFTSEQIRFMNSLPWWRWVFTNPKGHRYIPGHIIIDLLDAAFGSDGWTTEQVSKKNTVFSPIDVGDKKRWRSITETSISLMISLRDPDGFLTDAPPLRRTGEGTWEGNCNGEAAVNTAITNSNAGALTQAIRSAAITLGPIFGRDVMRMKKDSTGRELDYRQFCIGPDGTPPVPPRLPGIDQAKGPESGGFGAARLLNQRAEDFTGDGDDDFAGQPSQAQTPAPQGVQPTQPPAQQQTTVSPSHAPAGAASPHNGQGPHPSQGTSSAQPHPTGSAPPAATGGAGHPSQGLVPQGQHAPNALVGSPAGDAGAYEPGRTPPQGAGPTNAQAPAPVQPLVYSPAGQRPPWMSIADFQVWCERRGQLEMPPDNKPWAVGWKNPDGQQVVRFAGNPEATLAGLAGLGIQAQCILRTPQHVQGGIDPRLPPTAAQTASGTPAQGSPAQGHGTNGAAPGGQATDRIELIRLCRQENNRIGDLLRTSPICQQVVGLEPAQIGREESKGGASAQKLGELLNALRAVQVEQ